jgi:Mg/Co/Ni transporter MgtE
MTANQLTTTNLPRQVATLFKDASKEELELINNCYSGDKQKPTFQEWLESYQQNKILQHTLTFEQRGQKINDNIETVAQKLAAEQDQKEKKNLLKELKRLESLRSGNEEQWLHVQEKLAKINQNQLAREAPRKLDVTHNKVTPADVAQLLHEAKEDMIKVEFEEVNDE